MIYIRVWEGLGNQMFQYAYARSLQLRNNVEVQLCSFPDNMTRTLRQYELDKLRIHLKCSKNFYKIAKIIENNRYIKIILKYFTYLIPNWGYLEEQNTKYNADLMNIKGKYYICGWFQNENYFKEYREIIQKELYPKHKIKISSQLRYILNNENTVSVHIRRGDYKKMNNVIKLEYYKKAFHLMESYFNDVFYIVFSDDLKWVKENIIFGDNVYFLDKEYELEDYEELFIMSKCNHNIIANSTFSWWGAWLNKNKEKIVIGPKRWFADSKLNIMPDDWIRI